MQLMVDVNIDTVFVGIETPNDAALRETKKLQNVRSGGTMVEKVHRIQDAGMEVWSGMILGFDSDDASIFEAQRRFIREARIVHAMVGMLAAIPRTPCELRAAGAESSSRRAMPIRRRRHWPGLMLRSNQWICSIRWRSTPSPNDSRAVTQYVAMGQPRFADQALSVGNFCI
jgi:hypothetical protein